MGYNNKEKKIQMGTNFISIEQENGEKKKKTCNILNTQVPQSISLKMKEMHFNNYFQHNLFCCKCMSAHQALYNENLKSKYSNI